MHGRDVNLSDFKRLVDQGDPFALYAYGTLLFNGYYKELFLQDKKAAFEYFKAAADRGHYYAMFACGRMLYDGKDVKKDLAESLKYLKEVVNPENEANRLAFENLNEYNKMFFLNDPKIPKFSMKQYIATSAVLCARILSKGNEKNKKEAIKYSEIAIENGFTSAEITINNLSKQLQEANKEFEKNNFIIYK